MIIERLHAAFSAFRNPGLAGRVAANRREGLIRAAELLDGAADADVVAALAEAAARTVLRCDEALLTLSPNATPAGRLDPPGAARLGTPLIDAGGHPWGRLEICRFGGPAFAAADAVDLSQLAHATVQALQVVNARADARRAQADLEQFLSAISEGVFTLDLQHRVRTVNLAAACWLGRKQGEVLGVPFWDVFPGRCDGDPDAFLANVARNARGASFTALCEPQGAWLEVHVDAIPGGLLVFFRDVTGARETEEKLRQSQKLEAIGQLTGGIAHDINNMLTVILANLEALAERAEARAQIDGHSEAAREDPNADLGLATAAFRAGQSAAALMGRLLAFSRRQVLSPKVVDVAALLYSLEALLQRTLSERVTLRIDFAEGLWHALVDPTELESAVLNLALNAQDAMPSGGVLELAASNVEVDVVYAAVSGLDLVLATSSCFRWPTVGQV